VPRKRRQSVMAGRDKPGLRLGQHKFGYFWNAVKAKLSKLSEQYLTVLSKHLEPGSKDGVQSANRLGQQAVALGLETLDLARIHEQALEIWKTQGRPSRLRPRMIQRARAFFAEATGPIQKTHRAAHEAETRLTQLNRTLRERTVESTASDRNLKRRIAQRRAAEEALRQSGQYCTKLLAESRRLQKYSRHLAHEILSAQEDQRRKVSQRLHDEVAQILVGINVRLLALKNAAKANTGSLKNEIASTQRMVKQSVQKIHRFAHECGIHHET